MRLIALIFTALFLSNCAATGAVLVADEAMRSIDQSSNERMEIAKTPITGFDTDG